MYDNFNDATMRSGDDDIWYLWGKILTLWRTLLGRLTRARISVVGNRMLMVHIAHYFWRWTKHMSRKVVP